MQKLEKYAPAHGLDNITYTVADVRTVQLTPNFYDAIVAATILDHISEAEGKKVAEAMIDALKAGGFVFVEVFTIHDPAASATKKENETISETASFVRHFLDRKSVV